MYIQDYVVEDDKRPQVQKQWVKPAIDTAIELQDSVTNTPAEIRTPSSACMRCAYNAFAQQLGCINQFGACPYLTR